MVHHDQLDLQAYIQAIPGKCIQCTDLVKYLFACLIISS
jgi:hypothetical protein